MKILKLTLIMAWCLMASVPAYATAILVTFDILRDQSIDVKIECRGGLFSGCTDQNNWVTVTNLYPVVYTPNVTVDVPNLVTAPKDVFFLSQGAGPIFSIVTFTQVANTITRIEMCKPGQNVCSPADLLAAGYTRNDVTYTPGILQPIYYNGPYNGQDIRSITSGLAVAVNTVPEPELFLLLSLGMGGIWLVKRRKIS